MTDAHAPRWAVESWALASSADVAADHDGGLSTARIVRTAIELADESGLADLSIRKLGQRLGAGTMAAYRYIDSRDDLVILMVDAALAPPSSAILEEPAWQCGLRSWAGAILERYAEHPWLVDAPISGFPTTPNRALWLESVLQVLSQTGLTMQQMLDTALLVDGHARNTAYLQRETGRLRGQPAAANEWLDEYLDPLTYPMLVAIAQSGELEDDSDQSLDFGLDRIIAGIEPLAAGQARI